MTLGKLDYVCGWYNKAADLMQGTKIKTAFISTNSITQGESVGILWKFLFNEKKVEIQFAYRSFVWSSEAKNTAAVFCVIIGFTCCKSPGKKKLFDNDRMLLADHINGYLLPAPDVYIQSRHVIQNNLPKMIQGNKPWDGGNLILSEDERAKMIKGHPETESFIKPFWGSYEYLYGKARYCLWLKGVSPDKYRNISEITKRLEAVSDVRRKTKTTAVQQQADIPMLFSQIRQPDSPFLVVPEVTTSSRRYIPVGFLTPDIIVSNKIFLVPDADIYMFGIIISNVHMAWMRVFCGRLGMGYSYSPSIYNNFPWPDPTPKQRAAIGQTAQAILDARALYPDSSLADLYDDLTMPPELRKAHQDNDKAVMDAHGFTKGLEAYTSEAACVAELMKMYQKLTDSV